MFRITRYFMAIAAVASVFSTPFALGAIVSQTQGDITIEYDDQDVGLYTAPTFVTFGTQVFIQLGVDNSFFVEGNLDPGGEQIQAEFSFDIKTQNGLFVDSVFVQEFGEYEIQGAGTVSQSGILDVFNKQTNGFGDGNASYNAGTLNTTPGLQTWNASTSYDLGLYAGPSQILDVTSNHVTVNINNSLFANITNASDFARIAKSGSSSLIQISINAPPPLPPPSEVPLPAGFWLLGSALMLLGAAKKKARV